MVNPGLPRQLICLAAGQARQKTECGGEACALAESWCLTACLTFTTAVRGDHGTGNTGLRVARAPAAHKGSTPRYRAGQGPLPGASTQVETPATRRATRRYR